MKRVTIYVDEVKWASVKESAWQARLSIGEYLMQLHSANLDKVSTGRVAVVEGRIREVYCKPDQLAQVGDGESAEIVEESPIERVKSDLKKIVSKKKSKSESGCPECRSMYGHSLGCSQRRFA